jgi:21S rRNA (uridine2791-2'-O)-methyltransferase
LTHDQQGYAPGSWSQVAADRTAPGGRVVGVDVIPAQPPRGVSTIQGNFLSPAIQAEVRAYVQDPRRGRPLGAGEWLRGGSGGGNSPSTKEAADEAAVADGEADGGGGAKEEAAAAEGSLRERDEAAGRVVDVVLNDMCEPWDQTTGFWHASISDPYRRMMNTSGTAFRDHAGSMVGRPTLSRARGGMLICFELGPLHGGLDLFFRHAAHRRAFRLQVLPGRRGQGVGAAVEEAV